MKPHLHLSEGSICFQKKLSAIIYAIAFYFTPDKLLLKVDRLAANSQQ